MISREGAIRIGSAEIVARGLGTGARGAFLIKEITAPHPRLYNGPNLAECWIVYVEQPVPGLRSSEVVLVSRQTGEIMYAASANDES